MVADTRVVMVTGGTGALGSVVVRDFLDRGSIVAVPSTSEHSRDRLAGMFPDSGNSLHAGVADLTDEEAVDGFVGGVLGKHGRIDVLVNAAGGFSGGTPIDQVKMDEIDRMFRINFLSAFLSSRSVLRRMKERQEGRIICITSISSLDASPGFGPYAISKSSVAKLTETIAAETKGTGITANAIAPSIIATRSNKAAMPKADFSRWVTPEEISGLVCFLSSDDARSITGNVIRVPGGV